MSGEMSTSDTPGYDEWGCDPRAPIFSRLGAGAIALFLRLIYATLRSESTQPEIHREVEASRGEQCIGAFWHRHVGIAPYFSTPFPWVCLASRSRDGELLARIMFHLGGRSVRGSSGRMDGRNKGGASSLRQLGRLAGNGTFPIFTPDGPNGPQDKVKPGVIFLAAQTGLPIYPVGFATSRGVRLPTWDKTLIPLPFARAVISYGEPLKVPSSIDGPELEVHRAELERRLLDANEQARLAIENGGT
ncbi:MAG: lysophospholipid acyltransferase family protein [Nitrospinaceae bacterium]|nr:lysophospholipid acyltransferase family protein [Nitrospinaceae bacterium]MBT3434909.1 lysophospholipid acyltransferase family protein [Nitrospinaceae bacterium]MBT3822739.1 lysophospholipid acyltransferase family protein [Nitrospinaceae bacterium]MBT4093963.1 lysophospholipid acyltransferase family protein [Nitrospinaceae bacterium]MBT4431053.1 lysophospholipid acyltransferase family protein [Nitrospinaceae bacterium]